MSRHRLPAAALAALVALTLVVGCSSSDGSEGAEAKTSTTAAGSGSDRSTTTEADDEAPETTETTEAGGDTPTTAGGDIELEGDFCDKAKQLETLDDDIFGEETTDTSPAALLASLKELFRTLDVVYRQLDDDAPAAIADDIDTLAEFASSNYEKVKDMDSYEDAAEVSRSAFGGDAASEEFQAASDRIGTYVEEECGGSSE